jgi:hypothetical protein
VSFFGQKAFLVPERVTARCLRRIRSSITFNPHNAESVAGAKQMALKQDVPARACGEYCSLPCTLRRLEDSEMNYLMDVFDIASFATQV